MEKTATQKAWEAFVKKWQLVIGRAKRRGATEDEINLLCDTLQVFKKYSLHTGVFKKIDRKEDEG